MSIDILTCSTLSNLGLSLDDLESTLTPNESHFGGHVSERFSTSHPWVNRIPCPIGTISMARIESRLDPAPLPRFKQLVRILVADLQSNIGGNEYFDKKRVAVVVGTTTSGLENWFRKFSAAQESKSADF